MRFPTPELLNELEVDGQGKNLSMPPLTAREAWLLDQFLEEVHGALWNTYAETILDYEDWMAFPDLHPPEEELPNPPPRTDYTT